MNVEGRGRTARVLVVEDEYFVALDLEGVLSDEGHVVVGIATDADEAVRLAEREKPDLVLMDVRLARGSDGIAAAISIRQRVGVPCVFLTAHADDETKARAAPARPVRWIAKPFRRSEVVSAVADFVGRRLG